MVRRIIGAAAFILLLAGIAMVAYPYIAQWQFDRESEASIAAFDAQVEAARTKDETSAENEGQTAYLAELYAEMTAYNQNLYETSQSEFRDAYSYQPASFELTEWGLESNMMGYIEIPRMHIKLPLYLGASMDNMKLGAGHMSQTSLPIGGKNTNSVIAAHRDYTRAAMFRDIEALQIGDVVYITNLWETLTYKVVGAKIIAPDDVQQVTIRVERDLVTLLTCHPYRHNSQRYIVYCERVEAAA